MKSFLGRAAHSPIPRLAAALVALAWSSPAFWGEIHDAAAHGDLAKVKALLKDNPDLVFTKDRSLGMTPLLVAALAGRKDVAEFLLASKADVNTRDKHGQTPLHWSADRGYKDVAELLLANNSDVDARDNDGATPLHLAVRARHKDVAELLLASKADVNARDDKGETPLHVVAFDRHKDVVELLRQHGGHE